MIKNKFKKYFIDYNSRTIDVIKKINRLGGTSLIVTKNKNNLKGILGPRDLRKAILSSRITDKTIKEIYNKKTNFIYSDQIKKKIKDIIFDIKKINIIPVIDRKTKKITNVLTNETIEFIKKKKIKKIKASVVIMAGGRGERLMPYTSVLPKPLLPVNNKPAIQHILEKFLMYSPDKVFITINYKSNILESYIKEIKKKNKSNTIITIREEKPLGTAGSLFLIQKRLTEDFFLTNCDTIINTDYSEIYNHHKKNKNDITILTVVKKIKVPYGVCTVSKDNFKMEEKPQFTYNANTGFYLVKKECLNIIKKLEYLNFNNFLLNCQKNNKKIAIYNVNEKKWTDIGQMREYRENFDKQV